jgi:hypothetical protein
MGRYYSGDIEGKFWVAVQSSGDASFFGGTEYEPNCINYSFNEDDLPEIKDGIKECLDSLGKKKEELDKFFAERNGYSDEMIMEELGVSKNEVNRLLEWYARLELGEKILKCVEEKGECNFEAEL